MKCNDGTPPTSGRGHFFAIDRRTWELVCALGMGPAVAYLLLARFSARNNRTTLASVQAVEKYTGIARSRARTAIMKLVDADIVQQRRGGTRPKYHLLPYEQIPAHRSKQALPPSKDTTDLIWLPNSLV